MEGTKYEISRYKSSWDIIYSVGVRASSSIDPEILLFDLLPKGKLQ
jgi:hypothetical protein